MAKVLAVVGRQLALVSETATRPFWDDTYTDRDHNAIKTQPCHNMNIRYSFAFIFISLFIFSSLLLVNYRMDTSSNPRTYEWSSKIEGWHERAHPHDSPHSIDFNQAKILMASHYSADGGSGFNMALFQLVDKKNVAVDGRGRVIELSDADATAFSTLLDKVLPLPTREYRIHHLTSCQPFDLVNVATAGNNFEKFSIYGFQKSMRDLEDRGGHLPDALWELYGLIDEGNPRGQDEGRDETVLEVVKERVERLWKR